MKIEQVDFKVSYLNQDGETCLQKFSLAPPDNMDDEAQLAAVLTMFRQVFNNVKRTEQAMTSHRF